MNSASEPVASAESQVSNHEVAKRPVGERSGAVIGKSNRVYEIQNHKRPLILGMIRRLHQGLGIPADVLIAETVAG